MARSARLLFGFHKRTSTAYGLPQYGIITAIAQQDSMKSGAITPQFTIIDGCRNSTT
jgi:hypothetical protein